MPSTSAKRPGGLVLDEGGATPTPGYRAGRRSDCDPSALGLARRLAAAAILQALVAEVLVAEAAADLPVLAPLVFIAEGGAPIVVLETAHGGAEALPKWATNRRRRCGAWSRQRRWRSCSSARCPAISVSRGPSALLNPVGRRKKPCIIRSSECMVSSRSETFVSLVML